MPGPYARHAALESRAVVCHGVGQLSQLSSSSAMSHAVWVWFVDSLRSVVKESSGTSSAARTLECRATAGIWKKNGIRVSVTALKASFERLPPMWSRLRDLSLSQLFCPGAVANWREGAGRARR